MHCQLKCFDSAGSPIEYFYQWDSERKLYIHEVPYSENLEAQFYTRMDGEPTIMYPTEGETGIIVDVPDELLEKTDTVFAYIYKPQETGSGKTYGVVRLPVRHRVPASEGEYVEEIEEPEE